MLKWIARHPILIACLVLCLACYALGARRVGGYLGHASRTVVSGCVNFGAGVVSGVAR